MIITRDHLDEIKTIRSTNSMNIPELERAKQLCELYRLYAKINKQSEFYDILKKEFYYICTYISNRKAYARKYPKKGL